VFISAPHQVELDGNDAPGFGDVDELAAQGFGCGKWRVDAGEAAQQDGNVPIRAAGPAVEVGDGFDAVRGEFQFFFGLAQEAGRVNGRSMGGLTGKRVLSPGRGSKQSMPPGRRR